MEIEVESMSNMYPSGGKDYHQAIQHQNTFLTAILFCLWAGHQVQWLSKLHSEQDSLAFLQTPPYFISIRYGNQ